MNYPTVPNVRHKLVLPLHILSENEVLDHLNNNLSSRKPEETSHSESCTLKPKIGAKSSKISPRPYDFKYYPTTFLHQTNKITIT